MALLLTGVRMKSGQSCLTIAISLKGLGLWEGISMKFYILKIEIGGLLMSKLGNFMNGSSFSPSLTSPSRISSTLGLISERKSLVAKNISSLLSSGSTDIRIPL